MSERVEFEAWAIRSQEGLEVCDQDDLYGDAYHADQLFDGDVCVRVRVTVEIIEPEQGGKANGDE